jgi:2-haloacid dehalogenase
VLGSGSAGRPRSVIFDVGNVLAHWHPRHLYAKLIADPAELDWFLTNVVTLDWHFQHDAGVSMRQSIPKRIAEFPHYADLIQAFQDRWLETIPGPVAGVAELVERLEAKGATLYAITNFSAELYPAFAEAYPVMQRFRDVLVSGEVGLIKPDPAIYRLAFARFGVAPHEAFFIDDRAENIAAGEALGMPGHVFTDAARLEAELNALGLL